MGFDDEDREEGGIFDAFLPPDDGEDGAAGAIEIETPPDGDTQDASSATPLRTARVMSRLPRLLKQIRRRPLMIPPRGKRKSGNLSPPRKRLPPPFWRRGRASSTRRLFSMRSAGYFQCLLGKAYTV